MRAVEDLLNQVRDPASRDHLHEAIRAYSAGALRSAVISTWVAVALDLTGKIRELAELGELEAKTYVQKLDQAIDGPNVPELQRLENQLLDTCRDRFELIGQREHQELSRLYADRHVCAHPAYVSPEQVFAPTPEQVRAHLAVVVDAVLRHPPTPGRRALDRFMAEARGTAWPYGPALAEHLRARYLDRGKASLQRNLAQVIVKGCLEPPDGDEALSGRMREAALALDVVAPDLLEQALREVVTRREETSGLNDDQLLRLIGTLGGLTLTWHAIPPTSCSRAVAVLRAAPAAYFAQHPLAAQPADPEAAAAVLGKLEELERVDLAHVVAAAPDPVLVPLVLRHLREAGGYRSAEAIMSNLVLPLAGLLTADDLQSVAEAIGSNRQIREASYMPAMVEQLFDKTADLPGALPIWQELSGWLIKQSKAAQGEDEDASPDPYSYPGLARLLEQRTG